MTVGYFRDGFPRVSLSLPGLEGPLIVEFVVDTGFDGDMSLPLTLVRRLDATHIGPRDVLLADLSPRVIEHFEFPHTWLDQERMVEVMVMEGRPLLGTGYIRDQLLQVEVTDGGAVQIEPL